ncbi:hypothetical protein KBD71_01125 [Candidatus Woesebacteria bacterium]|nr:hypothetical protein [Candidatus Woesebacteria bacterium]
MQQIKEQLVLDSNNAIMKDAFSKQLDEIHRQLGTPRMREFSNPMLLEMFTHLYAEFLIIRLLTAGNVNFDQLRTEFESEEGYNEWLALDSIENIKSLLMGVRRG